METGGWRRGAFEQESRFAEINVNDLCVLNENTCVWEVFRLRRIMAPNSLRVTVTDGRAGRSNGRQKCILI